MPYIIPLFIHFRHTPGVPMSENPNAHWGTGASVRVEFRDRSCAYGSLPDAPDSIAGRGRRSLSGFTGVKMWSVKSGDTPGVFHSLSHPHKRKGAGRNRGGYTVAALRFPALLGRPNAPRSRNRLAFETAGRASPVSPVLLPEAKEEFLILFRRACTCRKFPDSDALGGVHQSAD